MDSNETSQNPQTPPQVSPGAEPQVISPTTELPAVESAPMIGTVKKAKTPLYIIILLLIAVASAVGAYYYGHQPAPKPASPSSKPTVSVNTAKKQYSLNDSVAGYIQYKPAAFQEVTATKLPQIPVADPEVNSVIVEANVVGFSGSGLYLYDLKANKTYKLTDGGGSPRIMSDHYLLYGFDEGNGVSKQLGGKLLDLQTGKTQTIFSDAPENVPGTVCCSVSPDGLKAAFVQKNKISIWDIRSQSKTDYQASVNPIDPAFSRTSANPYAVETSYATPVWLDNETLAYTDKPAAVEAQANSPKQTVDNKLYKLDTASGKSTEIKTGSSGIYDIYVNNGSIFINEEPTGQTYTQISVVPKGSSDLPHPLGVNPGFNIISPSGDKVYMFAIQDNPNAYSTVSVSQDSSTPGTFDPHISGIKVSQILPRGWIDNDRMLLAEFDTAGTQNHEYIAIYNTNTNKVEQYLKIS